MNIVQSVISWADEFQRRHPIFSFPFAVIKKYSDDEAGKQAALLAYYGFLSLFPLLMVLMTLLKYIAKDNPAFRDQIVAGATEYFAFFGDNLQDNIHSMNGTGIAFVVGILLTLFGARGVADIFRGMLNHVWQVPYMKRAGFPLGVFRSFVIMFVGGFGLLAAPLISGYAVGVGHGILFRLAAILITLGILFGVFLFVFKMALVEYRSFKELWLGAAIAAVGLTFLQSIGGYLLTNHLKNLNDLYGAFAVVLGLLYWLYLQTQVLLYAIEIDSVRVLGLWPRALDQKELTDADRQAFRLYAHRNRFHEEEEIDVKTKRRSLLKRLTHKDEEKEG